jgi:hypothetical protein
MQKRYRVTLTSEEREQLQVMLSGGRVLASAQRHARILLKADEGRDGPGLTDAAVAEAVECGTATVERARTRFVEDGLEAALRPKPTSRTYVRKLGGEAEAHLIALACSDPPEGRNRWSLRLLADRLVALGIVEDVSYETVRRTLKKTNSSLG